MKAPNVRIGVWVTALLLCGATVAEDAKDEYLETIDLSFPLKSGGEFSLSNKNGSLEISTWDKEEVRIVAEKKMRLDDNGISWLARLVGLKSTSVKTDEDARKAFDELKVQVAGDDTRREVTTEYPSAFQGVNFSVMYRVTTPRSATVRAELTNGSITVEKVAGLVDVQSVNGAVALVDVEGHSEARSTNGRINIEDARGNVVARTTNGSVNVELGEGPVGDVELRSVNGSVTLEAHDGAAFGVEIETVHGSATCEFPIASVDEQSRKHIRGQVGDGGGNVSLRTTNGSARVRRL